MSLFGIGQLYPHPSQKDRVDRYKENKKLFLGQHYDAFKSVQDRLNKSQSDLLYISVNLPGIICKKSADFLFGETPTYSAGKDDNSPEQKALERIVKENNLNITNYQSALANAYRGDSYYKVRWGQEWEGLVDKKFDPFRAIIEPQNPEYVFPECFPGNVNKIMAYHIAYPQAVETKDGDIWYLHVESHYPGVIKYSKWQMEPYICNYKNVVEQWKIVGELAVDVELEETEVPFPLVVHVPNYSTDDSWEGIDDLSEHKAVLDEINNRLSQIASILDKHSDPPIAVPSGTLGEDEYGNPMFNVGRDKVFEIMGKDDVVPSYITWNGQLQAAFEELKKLVDYLLICAELPEVALGGGESGTSGSSGLAIKFRLNSLLAKINRKRQFYNKGLKEVFFITQMLEHTRGAKNPGYAVTDAIIKFKDGLPNDELEMANIMSIRTGGKQTISQKTALMAIDDLTEDQAESELKRIEEESKQEEAASPSIFNEPRINGLEE